MNEPARERVRQFLLKQYVERNVSRGCLGFVFGKLSDSPPEVTYVFEHSECDSKRNHCDGEVHRSWLIEKGEIRDVTILPDAVPDERRGMWYRCRRVHFYIAPEGDWLVQVKTEGPLSGGGGRSRVIQRNKTLVLVAEGGWWKS